MFLARASAILLFAALVGCATDDPAGPGSRSLVDDGHTFTVDPNNADAQTTVNGYLYSDVADHPDFTGVVVRVLFAPPGGDTLNSISGSVTADADGHFTVGAIPNGSLWLVANESPEAGSPASHWSSSLSGLITSTGVSSTITVGLQLVPRDQLPPDTLPSDTLPTPPGSSTLSFMPGNPAALTSINGDVHGNAAGDPALAGIVVHVVLAISIADSTATLSGNVTTDATGHFSITSIPAGQVTLTANPSPAAGTPGTAWGTAAPAGFTSTGVAGAISAHLTLPATPSSTRGR